jgi:hypothetical protein
MAVVRKVGRGGIFLVHQSSRDATHMNASAPRIILLLAFMGATSFAQQPPSDAQVLDEVAVTGSREIERSRDRNVLLARANNVTLRVEGKVGVELNLAKDHDVVAFRRASAARQLPDEGSDLAKANRRLHLELLPDRLLASWPYVGDAAYVLAPHVDETDGVPAYIPFGADIALVNLDYLAIRDREFKTRISLPNAMHPQTRKCESELAIYDFWPQGANPYILTGNSLQNCARAAKGREGDLLFAEDVPLEIKQAVHELYDPIESRMAARMGSEPGNMFVAWWPDSPRDGYRLQLSWNRNSLLLLKGSRWGAGIDPQQRESLRSSFMREQIRRRIREDDWPGPFTRAASDYLLLLTLSREVHGTRARLIHELPAWLDGCARGLPRQARTDNLEDDVPSLECGLVLQFVYDAVARSKPAGKQDIYVIWRRLLDASRRAGHSGATPSEFLASSMEARRIVRGLVDGGMDWTKFAADFDGIGVKLDVVSDGASPAFKVRWLEHFSD